MRQTQPRAALAFDAGPISEYSQIISSMHVVPMLDFLSASEIQPRLLRVLTGNGWGFAGSHLLKAQYSEVYTRVPPLKVEHFRFTS